MEQQQKNKTPEQIKEEEQKAMQGCVSLVATIIIAGLMVWVLLQL